MAQKLVILGATGSVGRQALSVVEAFADAFVLDTLVAHKNVASLIDLALKYRPARVVVLDTLVYPVLKDALSGTDIIVSSGEDAMLDCVRQQGVLVLAAMVGIAGLAPVHAALLAGNTVALANKESLVCGGHLLKDLVRSFGGQLLPVDSEHSALWQVFPWQSPDTVSSLVLTASGGPFFHRPLADFDTITVADALNHPTWRMGAKISVDSATMMNKGLELIEAYHLFPVSLDTITVVVHPQSFIHGFVVHHDGSLLAHGGLPDMRMPISWALHYPHRLPLDIASPLTANISTLTFLPPDNEKFPLLPLARQAAHRGAYACIALNAANELAVDAFLSHKLSFQNIALVVAKTLEKVDTVSIATLEDVLSMDALARTIATECMHRL